MDGSISLCFDGAARQMVAPFCLVQSQSPVLPPTARGFSFGTVPNTPRPCRKVRLLCSDGAGNISHFVVDDGGNGSGPVWNHRA